MSDDIVDALEGMLAKARTGELSAVTIVASRRDVTTGGVGYVWNAGDFDGSNLMLLNAIRSIWQAGKSRWNWPPLGVDRAALSSVGFGRRKRA